MVNFDALQAILSGGKGISTASRQAIVAFASRTQDALADALTSAFYSGTLHGAPFFMKPPAAARLVEYFWNATSLEIALELRRSGIEQSLPEPPEKIVTLRRF